MLLSENINLLFINMYSHDEEQPIADKLFNELRQKKDYKESIAHCKNILRIIESTI